MKQINHRHSYLKSINDIELIKILCRDKEKYEANYLQEVQNELIRRKVCIEERANQIEIRYNYSDRQIGTIEDARSKIFQPLDLWDVYYFTNILNETLLIQHIYFAWITHFFVSDYYCYSFLTRNLSELDQILTNFLALKGWEPVVNARITDWEELVQLDSYETTKNLVQKLADAEIPFSVKKPELPHFNAIFGTYYETSKILVVVPQTYRKHALQIVDQIESRIEQLQKKLEISEAQNDHRQQIEIYNELEKLMPDDAILSFNKGYLLYETGEFLAAADALIQSIHIQIEKNQIIELEEIKTLLLEISKKFPHNINLLHGLATLARLEEDIKNEADYYLQILNIYPADSIAHINLGYLYYSEGNKNEQAKYHFQRYLELEPEAEDRAAVEEILTTFKK